MAAREKVITLKLSADEHRRFENLARSMELTVSAMIRSLVLTHENKEIHHAVRKKEGGAKRRQNRSK
jgi:predicted transcriptional regulator